MLCVASSCLFLIGTSQARGSDVAHHEPGDKPEATNQELYTLRHVELPKAAKGGKAAAGGERKTSVVGAPSAAERGGGAGGKEKG